jgi:gluconolactonase
VVAYDVAADFTLSNRTVFATVTLPDGIVLDQHGNVYAVSFSNGVHVFAPDKTPLGQIPIPGVQLTNLAFGGADFKTLFLVGNRGLYRLPMAVKGYKTGNPSVSLRPLGRPGRDGLAALSWLPAEFRLDGRRGHGAGSMRIFPNR